MRRRARRLLPRNYTSLAQQRGRTFAASAAADMRLAPLAVSLARGDADGMRMGQAGIRNGRERGGSQRFECKSPGKARDRRNSNCCKFRRVRGASGEHERREKESSSSHALNGAFDLRNYATRSLCRTTQVIKGPNADIRHGTFERGRTSSERSSGVLDSGHRMLAKLIVASQWRICRLGGCLEGEAAI